MYLLNLLHKVSDLPFKTFNLLKRIISRSSPFSQSEKKSDSEGTFYEKAIDVILTSNSEFSRFRRKYNYREILEHVDFRLGRKYLLKIQELDPSLESAKMDFKRNDVIGKPRRYKYPTFGYISPTTLRYISVALDIKREIDLTNVNKVVEIGAGYGGQAAILEKYIADMNYFIFDLPQVQKLIQKYLAKVGVKEVTYLNLLNFEPKEFDLVVSNYAFSELPKELQIEYLEKVLLKSKNGYLIMNSGHGNTTGRSKGKITLKELSQRIPGLMVKEEDPLTSPDNYVIFWHAS